MLDDLNSIIDDVAKAMTSAPVDANVATRVGARIQDVEAQERAIWARPMWLVPAAAVCVLIVAVLFLPRKTTAPATARPTPAVDVARAGEPGPTTSPTTSPTPSPTPPLTLPVIDMKAMDVEPIVVPAIAQADYIDIDPIAIARIEIAPMP